MKIFPTDYIDYVYILELFFELNVNYLTCGKLGYENFRIRKFHINRYTFEVQCLKFCVYRIVRAHVT